MYQVYNAILFAINHLSGRHPKASELLTEFNSATSLCKFPLPDFADTVNPQKDTPPKVLLLCCSWGACVPRRSQRLCQLEFWLLVGTTMLDRLWARGQTKCNTPLMLATSVFGRIHRRPCYVMAQLKSRLDIPWPNDTECMGRVWYHFSCWYPLLFDVEFLAGCVGG